MIDTDYDDLDAFVDANRSDLINVIRHSSNAYARACAWALLDAGSDAPDLEDLEDELQALKRNTEGVA